MSNNTYSAFINTVLLLSAVAALFIVISTLGSCQEKKQELYFKVQSECIAKGGNWVEPQNPNNPYGCRMK